MAGTHNKPAAALAAGSVVLLLLLAVTPTDARKNAIMSPFNIEASRFGRNLLDDTGDECPAGFDRPWHGSTLNPATPAATWAQLQTLGWDLPPTRPTQATYSSVLDRDDFYSVQCETRFRVNATKTGCLDGQGKNGATVFGATHIRYNCTTKTFHILTYSFDGTNFETKSENMWAATCDYDPANTINNCGASGDRKFVQISGGVSGASCPYSGADPCSEQPVCKDKKNNPIPCPWCCQSAWAVTDNSLWIGWLAETSFTLPAGVNTTFNRLIVHYNGGTGTDFGSTTTSVDVEGAGICFDCDESALTPPSPPGPPGPPGPPEEGCLPGEDVIAVTGTFDPFCQGATSTSLSFTVTPGNTTVPVDTPTFTPTGCSIVSITGNTYQVTCPVDTSHFATDVTLSVTQNLGARCSPAGTGTVAAVPTPRPTITVTAPEGSQTVCSSDTQAVFEYILTSADGSPISVTEVTPASCEANISTVPSGNGVSVTCTGPWADFTLTLKTAAGSESCGDTDTSTTQVTAAQKPVVKLTRDQGENGVCSEGQDFSTFEYTATSSTEGDITVKLTGSALCKLQGGVTEGIVANMTKIQITCTKEGTAWPASGFSFDISAFAGPTDCEGHDEDSVTVDITPKPEVSVECGEVEPVCSDSNDNVTFVATVTNGAGSETMRVSAGWDLGTECSINPDSDVASDSTVIITCAKPATYTPGTATVTVTATAGGTSCSDDGSDSAIVTIDPKPTVDITGPESGAVCNEDNTVTFNYTVATGAANQAFNLTIPDICEASTGTNNVPAGSTVELTCTRVGQWPSPFLAIIQAVAGTETCDDTDDLRNTITVNTKPNVAVTAERSSRSVCANAANGVNPGTVTLGSSGSVTLAYTVTGLGSHTPVLTATSFHQSVTCDPPVHQGSGIYHVTCGSTGSLPSGFTIELSATAGADGCQDSGADNVTVTADCCTTGSSYVRGEGALSTGATSKSFCFSNPSAQMPCGNSNWGWRNQLGGEGMGTFDMYEGGGLNCENLSKKIGNITISCANVGGIAQVTLFRPQQSLLPATAALDQHFYVGCAAWLTTLNTKERSPTCSPPRFGPKSVAFAGVSTAGMTCGSTAGSGGRCGGAAGTVLQSLDGVGAASTGGMLVPGCPCNAVNFVFHQSAKGGASGFFTFARNAQTGQCGTT